MMTNPTLDLLSPTEAIQFAERALTDFDLFETFRSRSPDERERCLRWLSEARDARDEEDRVSHLLDTLWFGHPLPS